MTTTINIARDYSQNPGPRYRRQGEHSGEDFRDTLLLKEFESSQAQGVRLIVNFDGVRWGYPTSFLEEAFGGLARIKGKDVVEKGLELVANDEPLLIDEVLGYIRATSEQPPVRR